MSKYGLKSLVEGLTPEEKAMMRKLYWRGERQALIFSFSRYEGHAMAWIMYPFVNWLYDGKKTKEEKITALERQAAFWNMEAVFFNFCIGVLASLEKDYVETGNTTVETIESVKASLIGPFSAIGDAIFWITWRILVTGIALTFSLQGNILGPLFFIVVYNAPKYYLRWHLQLIGYRLGSDFLTTLGESGLMQQITQASAVLGTFMIGGMVPMLIYVPVEATIVMNGIEQPVSDMFNTLIPGFLELAVMIIMLYLIRKKVSPIIIVAGAFVIGIAGAYIGLF